MHHSQRSDNRTCGFTLLELMVTVAVIAILAAIALPSFSRVIASNRVASGVNEFIAATNMARSEAIRRGTKSGICASSDGATCGSDWNAGYLIYYMTNTMPATLTPIRKGKFNAKDNISGVGGLSNIEFTSRGTSGTAGKVLYKPVDTRYDNLQQCLNISSTGSASIISGACPL